MTTPSRCYSELSKLSTFEERFEYLRLNGRVSEQTFGFDRIFNQMFYRSSEWKRIRKIVIARDNGCDLGVDGYFIHEKSPIYIHHMNPILLDDIEKGSKILLDPEFLITTTHLTHNAIHYGDSNLLPKDPKPRFKNDTCPWKSK